MKITSIGASGFLGSSLIELLINEINLIKWAYAMCHLNKQKFIALQLFIEPGEYTIKKSLKSSDEYEANYE